MNKIKYALCIPTADVEKNIHTWKPFLVNREICETDESLLQLIPYVCIRDKSTGKIFMYTRGKAGQESRLHDKTSIGTGGHMDELPDTTLYAAIAKEAAREIEEETGCVVNANIIEATLSANEYTVIYTPESCKQVDRVHVAIAFTVFVDAKDMVKLEQGVILNPRWLTVGEFHVNVNSRLTSLENWSIRYGKKLFETGQLHMDNWKGTSVEGTMTKGPLNFRNHVPNYIC